MNDNIPYRLGAILVCKGVISEEQLSAAVLKQREASPPKPLGQVLIDMKLVSQRQLNQCLKRQKCLRWYAALAAIISAPSAAYAQDISIEDCEEYKYTKVSQVDNEGFHLDGHAHFESRHTNRNTPDLFASDKATFSLSGSIAVKAAMKTAAKLMWNQYSESDAQKTQFDFAVASSNQGYGIIMQVRY